MACNPFLLWHRLAKKKKKTQDKKPCIRVIFDIDETLSFMSRKDLRQDAIDQIDALMCRYPDLLSPSSLFFMYPIFFIYKNKTAEVFHKLLAMPEVEISFMTAGSHREDILQAFELDFKLKDNSLYSKSIFINNVTDCLKGEEICNLIEKGIFHKEDYIILVDNLEWQTESAREKGFAAIQATGLLTTRSDNGKLKIHTDPSYLDKLLEIVQAQVYKMQGKVIPDSPYSSAASSPEILTSKML
jgi:hypothetical protein